MQSLPRRLLPTPALALTVLLAASAAMSAVPVAPVAAIAHDRTTTWTATWTASPQRPSTSYTPNWSEQGFANQTVRQVVRISTGGTFARIRMSNAYGTTPLTVTGATVARSASGASIQPESLRPLTVNWAQTFTIPAGAQVASDPVPLSLSDLDSVTVTLYFDASTGPATYHAQAMAASYRSASDHRADSDGTAFPEITPSWYYLAGVDVIGGEPHRDGLVTFGDSLTDGYGSTPGANNRYPDELAERLVAAGEPRAVLNQGIGGNRVTVDSAWLGDSAISRFQRDVLHQPGVRTVIVLEGINDIGMSIALAPMNAPYTEVSAQEIIAGYRDLIQQAHATGIRVIGATLPPLKGSLYYNDLTEAKRDEVNTWTRTSGEYDAVVDFDRVLAAPTDEDQLNPDYNSGDYLHPNDAGYHAMANAINPADLG